MPDSPAKGDFQINNDNNDNNDNNNNNNNKYKKNIFLT